MIVYPGYLCDTLDYCRRRHTYCREYKHPWIAKNAAVLISLDLSRLLFVAAIGYGLVQSRPLPI